MIFAGVDGEGKKISIALEPPEPVQTSLYVCDRKFDTSVLSSLLTHNSSKRIGFIIVDGSGALFGLLCDHSGDSSSRRILHRFSVDLPNKHGRGGQSALRFSRLRDEARRNYLRKFGELAVKLFIDSSGQERDGTGGEGKVNVDGLVLAGNADLKNELNGSAAFDPRLAKTVIKIVDVNYGGENGFNEAIELASEHLGSMRFMREKNILQRYFDEIARDNGKFCFGIEDTVKLLEMGAVETVIVWENLEMMRYVLRKPSGEVVVTYGKSESNQGVESPSALGRDLDLVREPQAVLEWLADVHGDFGASFEIVSDNTSEGTQFLRGFGGIGGILRYRVDLSSGEDEEEFMSDDDDEN